MSNYVSAAFAALTLLLCPSATVHADADPLYGGGYLGDQDAAAYQRQLNGLGAGYTVNSALIMGNSICYSLGHGWTERQIDAPPFFPDGAAPLVVHGTEFHFCPEHYR